MDILSRLESVFKFDFSRLKKFQSKVSLHFQLLSNNKTITINGPVVIINPVLSNKNELANTQVLLRDMVDKNRVPILQDETQKLLEDFAQVDRKPASQDLITYFKGKIPASDIDILRQSIYVKVVHDRGGDIQKLKGDIIARYGNKGKNISNLYSAGYFDSQIKPMYEEMLSQSNFSPDDFINAYNRIVNESPYAVFINMDMSSQAAEKEVRNRIDTARNYGIRYLNIHGIGERNVEKIVFILEKLKSDFPLPQEIRRQGNVIVVKIQF